MPEYKFRQYKSCVKSQAKIMEELLETRIELNRYKDSDTEVPFLEKTAWFFVGAGVFALANKLND